MHVLNIQHRFGVDNIVKELNTRLGWEISEAREFKFEHNGDRLGWIEGEKVYGIIHYSFKMDV